MVSPKKLWKEAGTPARIFFFWIAPWYYFWILFLWVGALLLAPLIKAIDDSFE